MTATRADAKRLIARQLALSHGQVWNKIEPKTREQHLTLAENILATVERKMVDFRWQ